MGASDNGTRANTVRLRGRVSAGPTERELPSGSVVVGVRLSVPRDPSPMTKGSPQTVDWVDCSAWGAAQRRAASRWREGDVVEVDARCGVGPREARVASRRASRWRSSAVASCAGQTPDLHARGDG